MIRLAFVMTTLAHRIRKMPQDQLRWVLANRSEAAGVFVSAVANHRHKAPQLTAWDPSTLLAFEGEIPIHATAGPFVVKEKLVKRAPAGIQVTYFGDDFLSWFGDMVVFPDELSLIAESYSSRREALDEEVLAALGGIARAQIGIAAFCFLLAQQPNAKENGPLLTDGRANVVYAADINGILRAVGARRCGPGWYIFTCKIEDWDRWREGYRFFRRKEVSMPGGVR